MDLDRVVCLCMGVTVGNIKTAVENGAKSFAEVQEITQASTVCGQCGDEVKALIDSLLQG